MKRINWKTNLVNIVLLIVLFALIICPLLSVFAKAIITDGHLDIYNALSIISNSDNIETIINSLKLGIWVVIVSTVIAFPIAYILARTSIGKHKWLDIIFMIPFMTPPYIASMGWILFMQKRGLFQQLFPFTNSLSEIISFIISTFRIQFLLLPLPRQPCPPQPSSRKQVLIRCLRVES